MNNAELYWQTYKKLENELINLSHHIYISDKPIRIEDESNDLTMNQLYVYSPSIADLIVRCGVEIEAISKELYLKNGGKQKEKDYLLSFDSDCIKFLNRKWNFNNKQINIISPHFDLSWKNSILFPLKDAHIKQNTIWKTTYHDLKHNRYKNLDKANIKALLESMAALFLLNIYHRNEIMYSKYEDIKNKDYSFGSRIFSLNPPLVSQVWSEGNIPLESTSPFVATMNPLTFDRVKEIQNKEDKALKEYLMSQPEMNDSAFHKQLSSNLIQYENPYNIITGYIELGKFRINQKYKTYDNFVELKAALINSEEWNGWINQNNNHLSDDDISEENIHDEIEKVGQRWGLQLMKMFLKNEWIPIALNNEVFRIYIP